MPVKLKYGVGVKWGSGFKYGFGTSEPWIPSAGAARFNVESLTDPAVVTTPETSSTPTYTPESSTTPTYTPEVP